MSHSVICRTLLLNSKRDSSKVCHVSVNNSKRDWSKAFQCHVSVSNSMCDLSKACQCHVSMNNSHSVLLLDYIVALPATYFRSVSALFPFCVCFAR